MRKQIETYGFSTDRILKWVYVRNQKNIKKLEIPETLLVCGDISDMSTANLLFFFYFVDFLFGLSFLPAKIWKPTITE